MTVLLFAGEDYYPGGGWVDFVARFDDVSVAKNHIDSRVTSTEHPAVPGHWHIPPSVDPTFSALMCSTNGPDRTRYVPDRPAYTELRGDGFAWAQIVVGDELVMEWHESMGWAEA